MFKGIGLLLLLQIVSHVTIGQSTEKAQIFTNIVAAVGTEKIEDFEFDPLSINTSTGPGISKPDLNTLPTGDYNPGNNRIKTSNALIKISTNNFAFGVLMESKTLVLKRKKGNERLSVGSFKTTILKKEGLQTQFSYVSIGATLNVESGNPAGLYIANEPLNVIVSFE